MNLEKSFEKDLGKVDDTVRLSEEECKKMQMEVDAFIRERYPKCQYGLFITMDQGMAFTSGGLGRNDMSEVLEIAIQSLSL